MVRLTKISLAHRTVVLLLSLLTIALGVYAAGALKQELIPSIDLPRGSVLTVYPGAAPDVVEAQVSKPIETAVKGVAGVTSVTSKSSSGVSQVTAQWDYGLAADDMANKIRSAIDSISSTLPSSVDPNVVTGGTDDIPVVALAISSDDDLTTLSNKVTEIVAPALKSTAGVRDAAVSGQQKHEIVITYNQSKIVDAGIDPTLIGQLFAANSTAIPSGTMRTDSANFDVQTGTTYSSAEEISRLMLQGTDGPVMLSDVATVREQPVETTSISRVNGQTALAITVTKNSGVNTVTVSHAIAAQLPGLAQQLGNGAEFAVVFDQAPYIEDSIRDLSVEGAIGLGMAILVILLFLGSIRPTLITAISIPLSLLIALIGLFVGGYTLNILTLGALTVAIGRVVDDSIVVIENIKRHQSYGEFGRKSITNAVREVAGAVTSSTLTTVAVFLPIGLVGGQAGAIFRPFAVAVTVALLASLFVALTVVPMFASWFMKPTAKQEAALAAQQGKPEKDTLVQKAYLPVLSWTLAHRWITLLIALGLFAGTLALAPNLKTDFIGQMGNETLTITQKLPSGTGLAQTDAASQQLEAVLKPNPWVKSYTTSIGGSTSVFMGSQADTNQALYTVSLKPGAPVTETANELRKGIADLGESVGVVELSVGSGGNSSTGVVLYVESADADLLKNSSDKVLAMMKTVPGLTNVTSDLSEAREQLAVDVNEQKAADNGMTQVSIGQAVARAVRGQQIGTLAQGDTTLNVYLRSQTPVKSLAELKEIKLPVTQLMNGNAKSDAADKVTERSDKLQADAKVAATDAYNEQVKALQKSKASARKAVKTLTRQINKAKSQLSKLQKQLAAIPAKCQTDPTDPDCYPVPGGIFRLSQQISAVASQIGALSGALAQTKAGVTAADKQLTAVREGRTKSLEAQDKQQSIADAGKAAGDATADPLKLKAVADVKLVAAPASVTRVDGTRAATLSASSESSNLGETTAQITAGITALDLPDGVTVRVGGVSQQQSESFAQLGLAMLVAIFVVYLIMVATFGSLLQPLILLVSIPFAATGALGLSLITDTALGVPSMIGLLMLIGIVVTNAIVLIDLINQKRKAGASVEESIRQGARLRVRPIVMTALATVFALIPMGLGLTGGGGFISKPLAVIVIGGLISSTLLTLILVPVLYDILETWREKREIRKAERTAARKAAVKAASAPAPTTEA
ncbi:MAG TPA: efflux RND transporter permease subunit [Propionicimonas sp.]|uniref:efflux RND transporter permease subunit n=1 Tax=Propionicimonas sp. TaxID=1955623 RepID=UPI002F3F9523